MVNRPAAYYQHMIAGEKVAASAQEAETLRPLLANHVAWTSHGAGRNAQIEAPGSLEQLTHTGWPSMFLTMIEIDPLLLIIIRQLPSN